MTIDRGALQQRLISLLAAEAAQVKDFVAVLEQERAILSERDVEPLFALAERKNKLAVQLQQFANNRATLLAQAGLSNSRESVENLIGAAAMPAWKKFLAAAQNAHQLNKENGHLILERLQNNHQALAILMSTTEAPSVYGPDGQSHARPGSRSLGSV